MASLTKSKFSVEEDKIHTGGYLDEYFMSSQKYWTLLLPKETKESFH